jgi:hypothetical protein
MTSDKQPSVRSSRLSEILKGLPVRVEKWIRATLQWKTIVNVFIAGLFLMIISGVVEGESYEFWSVTVRPWIRTIHPNWPVTNFILLLLGLGWFLAFIFVIMTFLFYGADRRRLGQLETVGQENAKREQSIAELTKQIGELTRQGVEFQSVEAELMLRRKEVLLLDLIRQIDAELLVIMTERLFSGKEEENFLASFVRRVSELFGNDYIRACVYTPDPYEPDMLSIRWSRGVGDDSRLFNRWYIGNGDPNVLSKPRGIPGSVWVLGEGRVREHVRDDPDFVDPHVPKREFLPYDSILQTLIHPDDLERKQGVLCLDSKFYTFSEHDLKLVTQAATRLGWFLYIKQQVLQRDDKSHE